MKKNLIRYFLAAMLPLAVLLVRPLTPAAVLMLGQEIRLATLPVDPRDIFRGDYVTLTFAIERLDDSLISPEVRERIAATPYGPAPRVYVTLSPDDAGIWQPVGTSLAPPESGVYLRADATYYDGFDYGGYLKRYYVRENTGLELEEAAQRGEIAAVAKVWKGRAVLTDLETLPRN